MWDYQLSIRTRSINPKTTEDVPFSKEIKLKAFFCSFVSPRNINRTIILRLMNNNLVERHLREILKMICLLSPDKHSLVVPQRFNWMTTWRLAYKWRRWTTAIHIGVGHLGINSFRYFYSTRLAADQVLMLSINWINNLIPPPWLLILWATRSIDLFWSRW